jgi:tetratricopeptide (TPR) repeat protein
MSDPRPEEILQAEKLINQGKVEEALKIINNFEKKSIKNQKDQIAVLIIKGQIFVYQEQFIEAVKVGEQAYRLVNERDMISETINALCLKAHIFLQGKLEEALNLVLEAEKLLSSLVNKQSFHFSKLKLFVLRTKSWIYYLKSDYNRVVETAMEGMVLGEKIEKSLDVGLFLIILCYTSLVIKGEPDVALNYAMKGLKIMEELEFQSGISSSLSLINHIYYYKGNFNLSLEYCKKSLSIKEISVIARSLTLMSLGGIYREQGELERALKYYKEGIKHSENTSQYFSLIMFLTRTGTTYRMKGNYKQALLHINRSIDLSEEHDQFMPREVSMFDLFLIHLESNSSEQAHQTLEMLKKIADRTESKIITQIYLLAKALLLKTMNRARYKAEAESILKQIIDDEILHTQIYILSLVSLCDFLFKELYEYNEVEILDELEPLIIRLLTIAEDQNSYLHLAEGKLLQAKLALIQMNIEEAKILLTEAQRIAELHDLNLLAHKISSEHDNLLDNADKWENLKKKDAPMAERIDLASIEGVMDRLQEKRAVESLDVVNEQPTLLLIIAEGGVLIFSHAFTGEWKRNDELFSSFLSAFTSFSNEFFTKGLDRAKFGDDLILMQSVSPFSICYLFKGQTYPATQRLTQFIEKIQNSTVIWQTLEKFYETSQVLELKDNPVLDSLITEIFINKVK